jgi:hypothetical protein
MCFAADLTIGRPAPSKKGAFADPALDDAAKKEGLSEGGEQKPTDEAAKEGLADGDVPSEEAKPEEAIAPAEEPAQASEFATPITINARTGGVAQHWWWDRCVHDFAGMRVPPKIAIDYCHNPSEVLGFADKVTPSDAMLVIMGLLTPFGQDRAAEVLHKAALGVPYQASIFMGLTDYRIEEISAGQTAEVNGQTVTGPVTIFREWSLLGLAICPYGSDTGTSVALDADDGVTEDPTGVSDTEPATTEEPTKEGLSDEEPKKGFSEQEKPSGEFYMKTFGEDLGSKYFAKGLTFSTAVAQFGEDMQTQQAALQERVKKAEFAVQSGGAPVSFGSAEPPEGKGAVPAAAAQQFSNCLPPGLAKMAANFRMPGSR